MVLNGGTQLKKIVAEAEFTAEQLNNIRSLAHTLGLCEQTVSVMYGRGIDTEDKIQAFITPGRERFLSPFLMSGMREAVDLIRRARDEEWSVVVYGDYDADGICASTILCRSLVDFGVYAAVFVPERRNGYGLNVTSIDEIFEEHCPQLFITVDCGISNSAEVEYIKEQGAEVIVTDHHELPDVLPDCICINPKIEDGYPYNNLCGAGVAFKLGVALNGRSAYQYLDFAALATVADSVPLIGENRDIVAEGLKLINASPRSQYANFLKKDERVTAQSLAFSVAPKINAAGRMGDAGAALTLFLSDDEQVIYDYSVKLNEYNMERQKYCDELYLSAKEMLVDKGANGRVIVLCGEDWNAGFVGIVAARLAEEYCRPAMLFVKNGNSLKGSARSIDGVNIYEALKSCSNLIEEFGGHSQAAGVNVAAENIGALEEALNAYLYENYTADAFTPSYYVNGKVGSAISAKLVKELNLLEPYGVGNRKPLFVMRAGSCGTRLLKENSPHLAVKVENTEFIYFSGAKYEKIIKSALPKWLVFEYSVSTFKGREQLGGYLRDVVYGTEDCSYAARDAVINGISQSAAGHVECAVSEVSKERVQGALKNSSEYGTAFIAYDVRTLKKYDLCGIEVNIFTLSASNSRTVILVSPVPECDLSPYGEVVFMDNPPRITLPSLSGREVFVCTEIEGAEWISSISVRREDLLAVFKVLSAHSFNVLGATAEEAAVSNDFGASTEQALFALKVFEELGLISFNGGRLSVARGVKTQLTNSQFYNFIERVSEKK